MSNFLAVTPQEFSRWSWSQIEPYTLELEKRKLTAAELTGWLVDWSQLSGLVYETFQRLYVAITVDTTDPAAQRRYNTFLDEVFARYEAAEQKLKEKLLASRLEPEGFELPLRNLRTDASIFAAGNLPWLAKELKLKSEYDRITGAQTVDWQGQETTNRRCRRRSSWVSKRSRNWKKKADSFDYGSFGMLQVMTSVA
jgi:oligoendopeptidase F